VEDAQRYLTQVMRDDEAPAAARIRAAVELCRMQGAYVSRVEVSGPGGAPINTTSRPIPLHLLSEAALEELERVLLARDAAEDALRAR